MRVNKWLILVLAVLLTNCGKQHNTQPSGQMKRAKPMTVQWDFVVKPSVQYPSCHASTLEALPNGDLVAAWYAGSDEGESDVAVLMSRKPAKLDRWSDPIVIADTPNKPEGNPVLWFDSKGTLWLFYVTMYGDGWGTCKIKYKTSKDHGTTWSDEVILRNELGWMTRNRPLVLSNEQILLPLYDEKRWSSEFLISEDGGKSWKQGGSIVTKLGNIQPSVVQLKEGTLLAMMRSGGRGSNEKWIWKSHSRDFGRTWSPAVRTEFRNPNAAVFLLKLKSGNLLLAFNDSFSERVPLSVAYSTDGGGTWSRIRTVETEPPGEYSYPFMVQSPDGMIHLTYTYRRTHIKHVWFSEKDLMSGQ